VPGWVGLVLLGTSVAVVWLGSWDWVRFVAEAVLLGVVCEGSVWLVGSTGRRRGPGSGSLTSRLMRGPSMPAAAGVGLWVRTIPAGPGAGM